MLDRPSGTYILDRHKIRPFTIEDGLNGLNLLSTQINNNNNSDVASSVLSSDNMDLLAS